MLRVDKAASVDEQDAARKSYGSRLLSIIVINVFSSSFSIFFVLGAFFYF